MDFVIGAFADNFKMTLTLNKDKVFILDKKLKVTKCLLDISWENNEFIFHLERNLVEQLREFKVNFYSLKIDSHLISILYQNIFLCLPTKSQKKVYFQYGIAFTTCYHADNTDIEAGLKPDIFEAKVIRTFISLDGDIFQQIQKDFLVYSNCYDTLMIHGWLVSKFLQSLHNNLEQRLGKIILCFWIVVGGMFNIGIFNHFFYSQGLLIFLKRLLFGLIGNLLLVLCWYISKKIITRLLLRKITKVLRQSN